MEWLRLPWTRFHKALRFILRWVVQYCHNDLKCDNTLWWAIKMSARPKSNINSSPNQAHNCVFERVVITTPPSNQKPYFGQKTHLPTQDTRLDCTLLGYATFWPPKRLPATTWPKKTGPLMSQLSTHSSV